MKRPLAVIGFSYSAALAAAFLVGREYAPVLALSAVFLGAVSLLFHSVRESGALTVGLISAAAALLMLTGFDAAHVRPVEQLESKKVQISAQLCDLPYKQNGYYYYKLKTESISVGEATKETTLLISSKYPFEVEPYDKIILTVRLYSAEDSSYRFHDISRGIFLRGTVVWNNVAEIIPGDSRPPYYYALKLRKHILDIINKRLDGESSELVSAMLMGDRTGLSNQTRRAFDRSGSSHFICVSGFHIAVITELLLILLTYLTGKRKRLASLLCSFLVFAFMAVVGFSPSVMRAGIMQILFLLSQAIIQKSDSLNSLGLAALVICFLNPYSIADISFQLSFASTLGIILCSRRLSETLFERLYPKGSKDLAFKNTLARRLHRVMKYLLSVVSVTTTAVIFTLPFTVSYFKVLTPYTLLTNILITLPASLLIILSVLMLVIPVLSYPVWLLAEFILLIVKGVSSLPFAVIKASQSYVPLGMSFCVIAAALIFLLVKRRFDAVRYSLGAAALIFAVLISVNTIISSGSVKIAVADSGEGLFVIVADGNETGLLYCGGDHEHKGEVLDYADMYCVDKIDYMLLTDKSRADSAYARDILEDYSIGTLHVYDEDSFGAVLRTLFDETDEKYSCSSGSSIIEEAAVGGTSLSVLRTRECNAVMISKNGKRALVLGAVCDCAALPEGWRTPDVLMLSSVPENAQLIMADYAVIPEDAELRGAISAGCASIYEIGGGKNEAVKIYGNGNISIRREKNWLS